MCILDICLGLPLLVLINKLNFLRAIEQIHRMIPTIVESFQNTALKKIVSMSTYALAIDHQGVTYVWGTGGSAGSVHGIRFCML